MEREEEGGGIGLATMLSRGGSDSPGLVPRAHTRSSHPPPSRLLPKPILMSHSSGLTTICWWRAARRMRGKREGLQIASSTRHPPPPICVCVRWGTTSNTHTHPPAVGRQSVSKEPRVVPQGTHVAGVNLKAAAVVPARTPTALRPSQGHLTGGHSCACAWAGDAIRSTQRSRVAVCT